MISFGIYSMDEDFWIESKTREMVDIMKRLLCRRWKIKGENSSKSLVVR
jgi:hypothetical protein